MSVSSDQNTPVGLELYIGSYVTPILEQRWYIPTSSPGNQHSRAQTHNTKAAAKFKRLVGTVWIMWGGKKFKTKN